MKLAMAVGLTFLLALSALTVLLGLQARQVYEAQQQRELFVRVGRQGALSLTTIDWQQVDTDVKHILDWSTGHFYANFSKEQQPLIQAVKMAQSKSVGTITDAGLESDTGGQGQVLVLLSVKTANRSGAEQPPQRLQMRISVQQVGRDEAKISDVVIMQ